MLKKWIDQLYIETRQEWKRNGGDERGFAIFYSPVIERPKIMIIGYNPGGGSEAFNEHEIKIPLQHDYIVGEYRLASKMRKIFDEVKPKNELGRTVKLNLIFFRSKKADDINNKGLIEYCKEKVKDIIEKLQPVNIITEGFKTFDEIMIMFKGEEQVHDIEENNARKIIRIGIIKGNIRVFGLIHPSGARGISDEKLKLMGMFISRKLNSEL